MGTVGLSFGSPTSGAGFNVSATVSAIVANLQNVETPWKTQLTTLESQDTAISSLGTLFSNLSNDISSLTDFQGILAQKTGSSSDTNVLTLTAANNTAVAGTHTVTVTNLAQTSSGYLAPVTSASDKLSGSIALQVGSGTAQTITLNSSNNTLSALAAAINSSGVGITASVLTDSTGARLSLVSGTSGAGGNIAVTANSIAAASAALSYSGSAGAGTENSTGTLTSITNAGDALTGSLSILVGSGTTEHIVIGAAPGSPAANTIYTGSGVNTLAGLASAIGGAGIGVTASVVTNSDGSSSLKLESNTAGSTGTLTVASSIVDASDALGYASSATGTDARLTVDGVALSSASNTVANLIPGVTFQLLSPSATQTGGGLEQIQVVIGNDNSGVESAMNKFVSDYNALIGAMNTQEGNNSSGNPEPLFGSPTLSLLQQQLLGGLNVRNPNGTLTPIATNANTTLSGSMTIAAGGGAPETIVIGPGTNTSNTFYTGSGSEYNTLAGLAAAINEATSGTPLTYSGTPGSSGVTSSGSLTSLANASDALSGSLSIQVGGGTTEKVVIGAEPSTGAAANTIYTGSGINTLSGLASAIDGAGIGVTAGVTTTDGVTTLTLTSGTTGSDGTLTVTPSIVAGGTGVTASVVTSGGQQTLSLISQTAGAGGAVTVSSSVVATTPAAVTYSDTGGYTSSTADNGAMAAIANASDALSGSMTISVGGGAAQTIVIGSGTDTGNTFYTGSGIDTLAGLASAITAANIGVTASVNASAVGSHAPGTILTLTSATVGSAGAMAVSSSIVDTTSTKSMSMSYANSSDIGSLTGLGIGVKNDGSLTFDAAVLDSLLNSDYSSVAGFFQGANGWGHNFSTMLTNAGTGAATGVLSLASRSNKNIESTLNADISRENSLISAQQASLTAELNRANQIMQELPSQLQGVNELYSAITGYNQNLNG